MYSVEIDQGKRLLVISAVGRVTRDEVKAAAQEVRDKVKDVPPGLRVLTDFRWMDSMESAAAPHVAAIMDALAEKSAALVVRVMPDPRKDIGLNILSQFHYGADIQLITVETLAEALRNLMDEK